VEDTDQTRLIDAAEEARAALERQSKVRHDLRAPLAVLLPLLSMMLDAGGLTDRQREQLETLERNVQRLDGMITSVAASGWFDCCATPVHPQAVALGALVEERVAAQRLGGYDGPLVEAHVSDQAPAALADRDRIRQIVTDLIDNASRFAPKAGPVRLSVGPGPDEATVMLSVTDAGPGIPTEELPHVTEFGYRGTAARDLNVPGLGLGLWASCRLAEQMGGNIVVESVAGSGTTVTLTLPVAE
jgi:signal transduction histidine kinase